MINNSLYFICPTDYLESVINDAFAQENYFFSSLGNSVTFNRTVTHQIEQLIKKRRIKEISFVLSSDNRIVLDALGKQDFSNVRGLGNFYRKVTLQKDQIGLSWKIWDRPSLLLSYHLNKKIEDFKLRLNDLLVDQLHISGKIYDRQEDLFKEIYLDLICMEYASLN